LSVSGAFQTLIQEYGSAYAQRKADSDDKQTPRAAARETGRAASLGARKDGKAFVLDEDRETGSVAFGTYIFWLCNMGSIWVVGMLFVGYVILAGARVANTLILGLWHADAFGISSGGYQGIYAGERSFPFLLNRFAARRDMLTRRSRPDICAYHGKS
jgi:hypothetical protein